MFKKTETLINKKTLIFMPMLLVLITFIALISIAFFMIRFGLLNQTESHGRDLAQQIISEIQGNQASEELAQQLIDDNITAMLNLVIMDYDSLSNERLIALTKETNIDEINVFDHEGKAIYTAHPESILRITVGSRLYQFLNNHETILFYNGDDVITGNNFRYAVKRMDSGSVVQVGIAIDRLVDLIRQFSFQNLVMKLSDNDNTIRVKILDKNHRIIASNAIHTIGSQLSLINIQENENITSNYRNNNMEVIAPISLAEKDEYYLMLILSTAVTDRYLFINTLVFSLVSVLAIFLFLWFQSKNVIYPVRQLDEEISKIDLENNMTFRLTLNPKNPFLGLSKNINDVISQAGGYLNDLVYKTNALKESEYRFLESAKHSKTMTWEIDIHGLYTYVSPICYELLGYLPEEIIQKKYFYDLMPDENREAYKNEAFEFFKEAKLILDYENPLITKSGEVIWVTTGATPIFDDKKQFSGYRGNDTDITERRAVNQQLQKTVLKLQESEERYRHLLHNKQEELTEVMEELISKEKMASLGSLVAGVAHEINTPLGVAITTISYINTITEKNHKAFLSNKLSKNSLSSYYSNIIESSAIMESTLNRAAELVQSFKSIAVNQHQEELLTFDLRLLLDDITTSFKHKLRHNNHRIQIDADKNFMVHSYPGALSQIFSNLIMNTITHGFEDQKNGLIKITLEQSGTWTKIHYSDNGKGMDSITKDRIYEPFFTLKKGSGGTGLGMSIVHNIVVEKLHGRIRLESDIDNGAQFIIEFNNNPQ